MKEENRNPRSGGDADRTMRICAAGSFQKLLVALVFLALLLPVTLYALYMGLLGSSLPWANRLVFLAGGALFGAVTVWGAYRALYQGIGWVEYNDETVIFHWDRRSRLRLRWEEIPGRRVQAELWEGGYLFTYVPAGEKCRLGANRFSRGFKDLERTMKAAGVLKRMGVFSFEDARPVAEQFFSHFGNDRKEEGDHER